MKFLGLDCCFFGLFGFFIDDILVIISLILSICCDCFYLSKSSNWEVQNGIAPKNTTYNISYFNNITVVGFLLYSIYVICDKIYNLKKNGKGFYSEIFTHILIMFMGIGHIGMCGNLGISCGFIDIFVGVFFFISWGCSEC